MVGPGVVRALRARGHEVFVLHRGVTHSPMPEGVGLVRVDRTLGELEPALAALRPEAVVDLCCYDADDARITLEACANVPRLLVVSSVNACGGPIPCPLDERAPLRPVSEYGVSKAAMESVFADAWRSDSSDALVVRLGPCYRTGASLDGQLVEDAYWLSHLAAGRRPVLADDGAPLWNLIHADDAGMAMTLLLGNPSAGRRVVLVGSHEPIRWSDYYELVHRALGARFDPVCIPSRWIQETWREPGFLEEMSRWDQRFDLRLLQQLAPGFEERIPLASGVAEAARWLIEHRQTGEPLVVTRVDELARAWRNHRVDSPS